MAEEGEVEQQAEVAEVAEVAEAAEEAAGPEPEIAVEDVDIGNALDIVGKHFSLRFLNS